MFVTHAATQCGAASLVSSAVKREGAIIEAAIQDAIEQTPHLRLLPISRRLKRVPRRIADATAGVGAAVADIRRLAQHLDRAQLGDRAAQALGRIDAATARLSAALDQVGGEHGLIASARRAVDAFGNLGAGASGSTAELERVLREIGDAALAFRELVEDIDRDPDMLVKGRARSGR